MPAPWLPDSTKNATLSALASASPADMLLPADTAWNMVRGQVGFTDIDETDDLFYTRYNWPGITGQSLRKKEQSFKEKEEHKAKSEHHGHS